MKRDWSRRLARLSRERRKDFCEERTVRTWRRSGSSLMPQNQEPHHRGRHVLHGGSDRWTQ